MIEESALSERESLLRQAQAGDREALGRLLSLYNTYLTLLARLQIGRRLQGKVDPSDLVQDTFLEAHRHFNQFRSQDEIAFAGWLRQILATRLANLIRHYVGTQGRDVRLEQELIHDLDQSTQALGHALASQQSSPSERASRREQAVVFADALASLPEHYRETIVLRHLEGLPFNEVAQRMGRSEDSVQKLWLRALASLRASLEVLT